MQVVLYAVLFAAILAAEPFWIAYWSEWTVRMKRKIDMKYSNRKDSE